jgi:hypothetical protein
VEVTLDNVNCNQGRLYYGNSNSKNEIISQGIVCDNETCINQTCVDGTLDFFVEHFSGYAYGINSNLSIWDDTDFTNKSSGDNIFFYANFTDLQEKVLFQLRIIVK